jgi:fructose/tagatose bisphosphate aldolase
MAKRRFKAFFEIANTCLMNIAFEYLQQIKSYVTSSGAGGNQPLVLHGTSGTGKTSILAKAAEMIRLWMNKPTVIILR